METNFIYGNGLVAEVEDGQVRYYHNDRLGSTKAVTEGSGSVAFSADYYPYGRKFNKQGSAEFTFTGKEEDSTRLYYHGARYYDADTGSFTQVDPVSRPELSPFVYANDNPLRFIDPTGMVITTDMESPPHRSIMPLPLTPAEITFTKVNTDATRTWTLPPSESQYFGISDPLLPPHLQLTWADILPSPDADLLDIIASETPPWRRRDIGSINLREIPEDLIDYNNPPAFPVLSLDALVSLMLEHDVIKDSTGYDIRVQGAFRTYAYQLYLNTVIPESAPAGESPHELGNAIDITIYDPEGLESADIEPVRNILEQRSWIRAGNWQEGHEWNHFTFVGP